MGLPRGTSAGRGFAGEVAVLRQFELPDPMGLETVRPQDALHPTDADAGRLRNGNAGACKSRWMRPPQHLPQSKLRDDTNSRFYPILAAIFTRLARDLAPIFRMT